MQSTLKHNASEPSTSAITESDALPHPSASDHKPIMSTSVSISEVASTPSPSPSASDASPPTLSPAIKDPTLVNPAHDLRLLCRTNTFTSPTSGLAAGHIQANLLILPLSAAPSFFAFCQRNPVPCPLLAYSLPGDPRRFISCVEGVSGEEVVGDFDVRRDAPGYLLWEGGKKVGERLDVEGEFVTQEREDEGEAKEKHVAFLIGCSFSFESALSDAGLPPRHWSTGVTPGESTGANAPMYRTNIPLLPAGVFRSPGTMVVSMRPYKLEDVERVREITGRYAGMHGEPVGWGWDAAERLGIRDIYDVDFGGPTPIEFREGEVPVFWGCGVTPQIAVMGAGDAIKGTVMSHKPGHMLLLDLTEDRALAAEKKAILEEDFVKT